MAVSAALLLLVAVALVGVDSACTPASGPKVKIGSFNTKQMGQSKLSKPDVMSIIYKVSSILYITR